MQGTYVKRGIWHLGGRRKQKGGFLPLLEKVARPLLVSAAGALGWQLLEAVRKKIFRGRKKEHKKKKKTKICLEIISL